MSEETMARFNHTITECGVPDEHVVRHDLDGSSECYFHEGVIVANEGGICEQCEGESAGERAAELAAERYYEQGYPGYDYDPNDPFARDR
jgi:hypothetical protein